jgi:hypothetical protein
MSENDALYLAQEFMAGMGSGAEPAEIASCLAKTPTRNRAKVTREFSRVCDRS